MIQEVSRRGEGAVRTDRLPLEGDFLAGGRLVIAGYESGLVVPGGAAG
jgi:hypothetical protein